MGVLFVQYLHDDLKRTLLTWSGARKPRLEHAVRSTPRNTVVTGISPRPDAERTSAFEIGEKDSDSTANASDDGEEGSHLLSTPIGLIGHFETQTILAHKGKMGSFAASLDMSKTKQELISTEEGVGETRVDTVFVGRDLHERMRQGHTPRAEMLMEGMLHPVAVTPAQSPRSPS